MRAACWFSSLVAAVLAHCREAEAYTIGNFILQRHGAWQHSFGNLPATTSGEVIRGAQPQSTTRARLRRIRRLDCASVDGTDPGGADNDLQQLMRILEHDLPRQYEKPQDLSVFSGDIEFSDPVTTLRGKLQYRGVLFFTLLFFRVACKPGSAYFDVTSIDRPGNATIRTVWETGARTWNGRELFISGVDNFSVNAEGRISRHDSAWDQGWDEVRSQVVGGRE